VAIILSPTIISVGVYLTLKHVSLNVNPALSRVRPKWYPWIFLPSDLSCLIVQAIGGGLAAAAGSDGQNKKLLDGGNHAIIAGIALQVVVLLLFGIVSGEYFFRVHRWIKTPEATPAALEMWHNPKFRKFVFAVSGAFVCILLRCIYR
jgi:RTA1 like protein